MAGRPCLPVSKKKKRIRDNDAIDFADIATMDASEYLSRVVQQSNRLPEILVKDYTITLMICIWIYLDSCLRRNFSIIHIPIKTNDQVQVLVNQEHIKMQEGECWYCNFNETHEVKNNGAEPRIHLIMDCIVNDWLTYVFEQALSKVWELSKVWDSR